MGKGKFKTMRQGESREKRQTRLKLEKKFREARQKAELSRMQQMEKARMKDGYITNLINARYYLARVNMLGAQIQEELRIIEFKELLKEKKISQKTFEVTTKDLKGIKESIDGYTKTEEIMRAEYAKMKLQGIKHMRSAHFTKKELVEKFGLTEDDLHALEKDYYDGKIVRESYDENPKEWKKARFVNTSKNKKK